MLCTTDTRTHMHVHTVLPQPGMHSCQWDADWDRYGETRCPPLFNMSYGDAFPGSSFHGYVDSTSQPPYRTPCARLMLRRKNSADWILRGTHFCLNCRGNAFPKAQWGFPTSLKPLPWIPKDNCDLLGKEVSFPWSHMHLLEQEAPPVCTCCGMQ